MRFISVDIETTGLDPTTDQILEIAMIDSETKSVFHCYLLHDPIRGNPIALTMNAKIIERIAYKKEPFLYLGPAHISDNIESWAFDLGFKYDESVTYAGKNIGGFDIQFLKKLPYCSCIGSSLKIGNLKSKTRTLDPTILYILPEDKYPPDLKTCCERAGLEFSSTHNAIEDASAVMKLLQLKGI